MHRIDSAGHVGNLYDEGDPGVPRLPTTLDAAAFNAVQEELMELLADAGVAAVKGTWTQVRDSLRTLFVRATGTANQTVTGIKTFTSRLIVNVLDNANSALHVTNQGSDIAIEADANTGTAFDGSAAGQAPTSDLRNTSTGAALKLTVQDAHYHSLLAPVTNLPTNGPSGAALGAGDAGAMVYVGGALNKLYVWDGAVWNACW